MHEYAIFDHLFDAVMVIDQNGCINYANESLRQLCGLSERVLRGKERAVDFIELPEECWRVGERALYREVGFVTRAGVMGRAQVLTDRTPDGSLYLVLRDVTAEARLQAKYKVQLESNERMIKEWQRLMAGATALHRMIGRIPPYADRSSALAIAAGRLRGELGFSEILVLQRADDGQLEPVGLDKRMGSRARHLIGLAEKDFALLDSGEPVQATALGEEGVAWLVAVRPRLERSAYLLAVTSQVPERAELRSFFEMLSAQTSLQIDCSTLYFNSMIDPSSGVYNRRFFDARWAIECERARDRQGMLSLVLVEIEDYVSVHERQGAAGADAIMATAAQAIKRRVRGSDFVARFDVQQIAVVLPETAPLDASHVAEALRETIEALEVLAPPSLTALRPSVSCGVAGFDWASDQPSSVCEAAQGALAVARSEGGHRVRVQYPSAV